MKTVDAYFVKLNVAAGTAEIHKCTNVEPYAITNRIDTEGECVNLFASKEAAIDAIVDFAYHAHVSWLATYTKFKTQAKGLNASEMSVLVACRMQIKEQTGNEFGFADAVKAKGRTGKQVQGYIGQLAKKGYLVVDPEGGQMQLTKKAVALGWLNAADFETAD